MSHSATTASKKKHLRFQFAESPDEQVVPSPANRMML